jgi:hypothetical protein
MATFALTRGEKEWVLNTCQQIKEVLDLIDTWLEKDPFNMFNTFINTFLALNCEIVAMKEYKYGILDLVFKCDEDSYIMVGIRTYRTYRTYYDKLKEELNKLGYGKATPVLDIYELKKNFLEIVLYSFLNTKGELYAYVGSPIELLRLPWLQAHLVRIKSLWDGFGLEVRIKKSSRREDSILYWVDINKNGSYQIRRDKYISPKQHFPWSYILDFIIWRSIYKKRNIIEDRIHKAHYLAVKIPTIVSL